MENETMGISISYLRECFILDEEHGSLFWRERPVSHFISAKAAAYKNSLYAGTRADHIAPLTKGGARMMVYLKKRYTASRVIFALHNGIDLDDVPQCVDHINGDQLDNRPSNLRGATLSQNGFNRGAMPFNTSGFKGVSFVKNIGNWRAVIHVAGRKISLGCFASAEDAGRAYRDAALKFHGEFARW